MKKTLLVVLSLVLLLLAAGCGSNPEEGSMPSNRAPDFQLESLDGRTVSLSELAGRPVMLNFWATWCGPCKREMPLLQEIYEDAGWEKTGLVLLAIDAAEPQDVVRQFMEEMKLTFTVLIDPDNEVFLDYNIRAIPTTYFIDRDGIIKSVKMGAFISKQEIEQHLEQITQ